ncbi:MAG: hypothetical protein Q4E74_05205 [Ruminococcus sp.]|nr:hypothetical protein [Ruminococcus sp.]
MNEFRIFDRYKTPEEWKEKALKHQEPMPQKPKISTKKTAAAICAGAAAVICAVTLPVMDGISKARQQTPMAQEPQENDILESLTSTEDSENNKSVELEDIEQDPARERTVSAMREECDNIVLGILLGDSEDGSGREAVAIYDEKEELASESIITFKLDSLDKSPEKLYIDNEQTEVTGLSDIKFGDEVLLGFKADENGVIDYSKVSVIADFGETNDEDFRHISKTADVVMSLSEQNEQMSVYYSEPIDADILNISREKLIRDSYANGAHSGSQIYSDVSNPFSLNNDYTDGSGILSYNIDGKTKRVYVMSVKANAETNLCDLIQCGGSTYIGENPGFFTVSTDDDVDPEIITINLFNGPNGAIFGIKPDLLSTEGTVDYTAVVNDESFGDRFYYIAEITNGELVTDEVKFDIGYCEYELEADADEGGWHGNYSTVYRALDKASVTYDYNILD